MTSPANPVARYVEWLGRKDLGRPPQPRKHLIEGVGYLVLATMVVGLDVATASRGLVSWLLVAVLLFRSAVDFSRMQRDRRRVSDTWQ